jgi:putative ABC transport system permease protein
MFKNYLRMVVRNFKKHRGYSLINLFGLSVSLACCIFMLLWVYNELSYDRFYPQADRIYRVGYYSVVEGNTLQGVTACSTLASKLNRDFPEVKVATRFITLEAPVIRYEDKVFSEERYFVADPHFFKVFQIPFVAGDPETALEKPNSLVINQSTAQKYFDKENPIGKTLNFDNRRDWLVTGVVQDIPRNAHFHFDLLSSMNSFKSMSEGTTWMFNFYYVYFILQDGVNWKKFEQKLRQTELKYIKSQVAELYEVNYEEMIQAGYQYYHFLQPLTWIHLHSHLEHELAPNGDVIYVNIFTIAALGILVLAVANFVNLSTARSLNRAREVGIRKLVGSTRAILIRQFLTESVLSAFFPMILALLMVIIIMPAFQTFSGKSLVLPFGDPFVILLILGFILIFGLLAGLYPAFFLSSFRPVSVLKQEKVTSKSSWMRSALVVFQFSIAIILVIGAFVVRKQVHFIQNQKLSMRREQIVIIHRAADMGWEISAFKQMISKQPTVLAVSNSNVVLGGTVGEDIYKVPGRPDAEKRTIHHIYTDADYNKVYGIRMVSGTFYPDEFGDEHRGLVINESAVRLLGLKDPVGQNLETHGQTFPIVGVTEDFHYRSIHNPIAPLIINVLGRYACGGSEISVRISAQNVQQTSAFLDKTWRQFSGNQAFEYEFFDDYYDNMYRAELRANGIFTAFAILAVLIAGLGLLGLSTFMVEQRTKEIGIRKVLGATSGGIVVMLIKQFNKWILISTVIAWPLAFCFMRVWLQNFAYKVHMGIWVFILSFLFGLLVVMLSVGYQTIKAARANPVDSLKYE